MALLRTPESEQAYQKHLQTIVECPICRIQPLKTFTHWKVIENEFPYDRFADVHHMLAPLRHVTESGLTDDEEAELMEIKNGFGCDAYEYILEATRVRKSIPEHFHLHLVVPKKEFI